MIRKFKQWLIERFLPVWAREALQRENKQLHDKIQEQEIYIKQLNAYIDGLEAGMRHQRRIVINNGEAKK